jgi:uncharacterized membrane protein YfhO
MRFLLFLSFYISRCSAIILFGGFSFSPLMFLHRKHYYIYILIIRVLYGLVAGTRMIRTRRRHVGFPRGFLFLGWWLSTAFIVIKLTSGQGSANYRAT